MSPTCGSPPQGTRCRREPRDPNAEGDRTRLDGELRRGDGRRTGRAFEGTGDHGAGPRPPARVPPADRDSGLRARWSGPAAACGGPRRAGRARVDRELVGRAVFPGHWTFQTSRFCNTTYYRPFAEWKATPSTNWQPGGITSWRARLKTARRTRQHPHHTSTPPPPERWAETRRCRSTFEGADLGKALACCVVPRPLLTHGRSRRPLRALKAVGIQWPARGRTAWMRT